MPTLVFGIGKDAAASGASSSCYFARMIWDLGLTSS